MTKLFTISLVSALTCIHLLGSSLSAGQPLEMKVSTIPDTAKKHLSNCHSASVNFLVFSPDGTRCFSASSDKTIKVISTETWEPIKDIRAEEDVPCIDVSPDGNRIAAGLKNGLITEYDVKSGNLLHTFKGHCGYIRAVKYLQNNRQFLSAADDGVLRLWNMQEEESVYKMQAHLGGIISLAISPDSARALSAGRDGYVCEWSLKTGKLLKKTLAHGGNVNSVKYFPDGSMAVTAGADGDIIEWQLPEWQIKKIYNQGAAISSICFTPDEQIIYSAGSIIAAWDRNSGNPLKVFGGHSNFINTMALNPDGTILVTGSRDKSIIIWNLALIKPTFASTISPNQVASNPANKIVHKNIFKQCVTNFAQSWRLLFQPQNREPSLRKAFRMGPRTAKWEDEINLERAKETFGAEHNPTGNPIGGGNGYKDIISKGDFEVSSLAELLQALKKAKEGQIIFIPGDASLNLDALNDSIKIPGGIILASNRGANNSQGALLYSDKLRAKGAPLFITDGDYVRLTGLRIKGPHMERDIISAQWDVYSFGVSIETFGVEIDNCELYGFATSAININNTSRAYIHHNYIHHNQQDGEGYGVQLNNSFVLVEANLFDWCRHHIASGGSPGSGYEARYNKIRDHGNGAAFDMHGGNDRHDGTDIAGDWMNIHHNTFMTTTPLQYSIGIRGVPSQKANIHHNWFKNPGSATTVFVCIDAFKNGIKNQVMWLMMPLNGEANNWAYRNVFGPDAKPMDNKAMIWDSLCYRSGRLADTGYLKLANEDLIDIIQTLLKRKEYKEISICEYQYPKLSKQELCDLILTMLKRKAYKDAGLNIDNIRDWRK